MRLGGPIHAIPHSMPDSFESMDDAEAEDIPLPHLPMPRREELLEAA